VELDYCHEQLDQAFLGPYPIACDWLQDLADNRRRCEDKPFRPELTLRDAGLREAVLDLLPGANAAVVAATEALIANLIGLIQTAFTVHHPNARLDAHGFLVVGDQRLNPARNAYHRVYNGRFSRGGRWYGPWWQALPSAIRTGIHINGEATCEPDIRGCHMRLLGARAGLDFGNGDPYALPDLPRDEIKLAINIMLNARSWASARGALIEKLWVRHGISAGLRADAIRAVVWGCFPALEPFWTTGYGLTLQNIDADVCMRLQRRLRDKNIPCLSIHDSFIVPQSVRNHTVAVMEEEFDSACRQLRRLS
jgi:hypothetical protein